MAEAIDKRNGDAPPYGGASPFLVCQVSSSSLSRWFSTTASSP